MAITVGLIKKLILDHIGGKTLNINRKQVLIDGRKIVIERIPGLSGLKGLLGQFTSAFDAIQGLVQNPLGTILGEVSGFANDLLAQVGTLGLPIGELNSITSAFGNLQGVIGDLTSHAEGLLGLAVDLPENLLSIGELMNVDATDVKSLAGSLFAGDTLKTFADSLNIDVPGGLSDLITTLSNTTGNTAPLVASITQEIERMVTDVDSIRAADVTAASTYKLSGDLTHSVGGMLPPSTGGPHEELFNLIATDELKELRTVTSISDDEDGDDESVEIDVPIETAPIYNPVLESHVHTVDDIVGLLAFVIANAPGGGASVWGGISGTLSSQTDLQTALNTKASNTYVNTELANKSDVGHAHAIADTTGLQTALDSKAANSAVALLAANNIFSGANNYIPKVTANTVWISQGNQTNIYSAYFNNLGQGTSGLHLDYASGGYAHFFNKGDNYRITFGAINLGYYWYLDNNAYNPTGLSYEFTHSSIGAQHLMQLTASAAGTGDMLRLVTSANSVLAKVDSTGLITSAAGLVVNTNDFVANTTVVQSDRPFTVSNTASLGNTTVSQTITISAAISTITMGDNSATGTATPTKISMGGTFSSSAGVNAKIDLFTDGGSFYGIGVSSGQLDYMAPTAATHNFYIAGSRSVQITPTGLTVSDDAYDATTWNANTYVPTKNAVRDKIESLATTTSVRPVAFFFTTTPTASEVLLLYTACESITLADDFAGSVGDVGTNPASSFVLDVQKNGASVGTVTISTGGVFTFVTSGSTVSLAVGDQLKVLGPVTPDTTIANVSITFKGAL